MKSLNDFVQTRKRLFTWLAGLLFAYASLGFLLLPWLMESQLTKILEERLSVKSEFESIYFNPFTFYLEIEQLNLSDSAQDELLHLGNIQINFQPSRVALLKLQFAEIRISDLDIFYARNSVQDDTVSRLAHRWADSAQAESDPQADPSATGELIPLEVLSLNLANINAHIVDEVPETAFSTTMSLPQAQVDNFSTLPDQSGNNAISIHFEEDARLSWSGGFSVNPLDFRGRVTLDNFSVLPVSRYLQDTLPFELDRGHIDLAFNYDINLAQQEPIVTVDEIRFSINDFSATQVGEAMAFIELTLLELEGGELTIPANRAEFGTVSLQELRLNATRNEDGLTNLQAMLNELISGSGTGAVESTSAATNTARPWFFSLESISATNNRVSFRDDSLGTAFATSLNLEASLTGIDNQSETDIALSTTFSLDSGGEISLQGQLQLLPTLEFDSVASVSNIAITAIQPYVSEFAFLELESGSLDLEAELASNSGEPFSLRGGATLQDLSISDQLLDETIFSMTNLGIDAMSLSLANNSLDISEVALEDFFARVLINEDGSSNIGNSLKPSDDAASTNTIAAPVADQGDAASAPLAITVGRVSLQNASANFTDRNLPLPFNANIQNLSGDVQGFGNTSSQAADINFEGQVDEFGLVQIVSNLNPFNFRAQSHVDVSFNNIDMPSMTPYVIKFAGREIAEGKVDVDLSYNLLEGELTANNQVVLSALQLGGRVEHADAMDLPLDLAIALLKDGNGVIDLEVPITGNVNDPEFDFGPAIRRAFSNILTNIVAAPFRLLGNLIGGNGDETNLEQIRFLPGRADVAAPEQEILLRLSEALMQRPQLLLEIPAATSAADEPALQILAVDNRIEERLEAQSQSEESLTIRRLGVLESLYSESISTATLDEIRMANTVFPVATNATTDAQSSPIGQLDTLAYIADLRERLILTEDISADELAALGAARRGAVVEFLTASGGISSSRLLEVEPVTSEEDDSGWLVLPFGLTSQ